MLIDKTLNRIISGLSLEYKLDKRVIKEVSFHPLFFFKRKAESGDMLPVRLRYIGVFVPKSKNNNNKMSAMKYIGIQLLKNLDEVWESLTDEQYKEFDGIRELEEAIDDALEFKNKPFLDKLWKGYKEYLKNI